MLCSLGVESKLNRFVSKVERVNTDKSKINDFRSVLQTQSAKKLSSPKINAMRKILTRLFYLTMVLCIIGAVNTVYAQQAETLEPHIMKIAQGADTSNCFGENNNYVEIVISSWGSEEERDFTVVAATSMDDLYVGGDTLEQIVDHEWDPTAKNIVEPAVFEMSNADAGKYYIWAVDDTGVEYDSDGDGVADYLTFEIVEPDSFYIEMELVEASTCYEAIDGGIEITFQDDYTTYWEYVEVNDSVRHIRFRRTYYGLAETLDEVMNMPTGAMERLASGDGNVVTTKVGQGIWYGAAYTYLVENRSELQDGSWLDVIEENCISRTYTLDSIEVKGLDPVAIDDTAKMVSHNECFGENVGILEVYSATGGSGNFVYTLQKDEDGTFVNVEGNVEVTGTLFTDLSKGIYIVIVTDLEGCKGDKTEEIEIKGSDFFEFSIEAVEDISCAGAEDGIAKITVTGGAPPYAYKIGDDDWQAIDGNTYDIIIPAAGTYTIEVRDELECNTAEKEVTIGEPSELTVVVEIENITACSSNNDGEIKVVADGGNTDMFDIDLILGGETIATKSSIDSIAVFSGLDAGAYTVDVYEVGDGSAGCKGTASAEVGQSDTISFDAVASPVNLCFVDEKGKIVVNNIAGGTAQYAISISPEVGMQDSNVFTDLPVGWYDITVADVDGGCSTIDSVQVIEVDMLKLDVQQLSNYSCDQDGSFEVTVSGGIEPYTVWLNDEELTESVVALGKGTHIFKATDASMCSTDDETIILKYVTSDVDSVEIYSDDTLHYVNAGAGVDTMLTVGEYHFEYEIETNCEGELTVFVIGKERVAPEVVSMTPQGTIEFNHPVFVVTFKDDITFNQSGYLYVTAKDSTAPTLMLLITDVMVDETTNTVTVTYEYPADGTLLLNTDYIVTVDSAVIMGDGLVWNGVDDESWTFTTGDEYISAIGDISVEEIEFKVFPNPFNNYIKIDNYDKLTRVVISNIAGQRVMDIEYPSYEISTGNLVTGVYIVSMFTENGIAKSERIIKR